MVTDIVTANKGHECFVVPSLSLSLSLSPLPPQVDGSLDVAADSLSSSQQYLISVTLHSGHNLAIRDRTGKSAIVIIL